MAAFEYSALDAQGRICKGVLEGDTARVIRQQLREKNLTPLDLQEVSAKNTQHKQSRLRISAADLALITRQLATLIRASLALEETLRAVSEQTEKPRIRSLLLAVRARVLEGHSLADSLALYPHVFSELFRATVAAGEQSGHLDLVLERLADYTENRQHLRQKTMMALFYPALLTLVALGVVVGLLAYVVPQVVQVFNNMNQSLPWLTQTLIHISDFLRHWGIYLFLAIISSIFLLRHLLQYDKFLFRYHHLLLKLPIISRLERGANVARFTRTLSILTESGVPMLDGLRITAQVVANRPMRQAIEQASLKVSEGTSLHQALEVTKLFPPMTVYLIASGEASGDLEHMLARAAIGQERELEGYIAVLLGLFEPLLILVMGGVVLTIVLAILMPIFELNQLVQ